MLVQHSRDYGHVELDPGIPLLKNMGIALCVRYSPSGDHLLVVRTNLKRGSVQIWRTPDVKSEDSDSGVFTESTEPIAWRIFEHQVLDACWISDDEFLVCGDQGLSCAYRLEPTVKDEEEYTAENVAIQGLSEQRSDMIAIPSQWDKICFDPNLSVAVFATTEGKTLLSVPIQRDSPSGNDSTQVDLKADIDGALIMSGQLTALAFQSHAADEKKDSSLLAATFEEGACIIYRLTRPSDTRTNSEEVVRLELAEGPALTLAWSPKGTYLAVGGPELVQIWREEDLSEKREGNRQAPLVTWRPDGNAVCKRNGEHASAGDRGLVEPSLSWSADGESLAFGVDRQVSVLPVRFDRVCEGDMLTCATACGHSIQTVSAWPGGK